MSSKTTDTRVHVTHSSCHPESTLEATLLRGAALESETAAAAATCFGRAGCGQAAQLDQGRKSLQPMGRAKGCRNHRAVSYLHSKAASHRRSVVCWKER